MSRTFTPMVCRVCGMTISNNGLARTSHYRKHVREGKMLEHKVPAYRVGRHLHYGSTFTIVKQPKETTK